MAFRWWRGSVLCAAAGLVGACGTSCPAVLSHALQINIDDGAHAGVCIYGVRVEGPDGRSEVARCDASSAGDCSCFAGTLPGEYHVALTAVGFPIDEVDVTVDAATCTLDTEEVVYEPIPASEVLRPACLAADGHLTDCGFVIDDARCIEAGLRATLPRFGEDFGTDSDCVDACATEASCTDFCAPAADITDLELCVADCLDASREDVTEYAPLFGPSEFCNLGGAGGAGG